MSGVITDRHTYQQAVADSSLRFSAWYIEVLSDGFQARKETTEQKGRKEKAETYFSRNNGFNRTLLIGQRADTRKKCRNWDKKQHHSNLKSTYTQHRSDSKCAHYKITNHFSIPENEDLQPYGNVHGIQRESDNIPIEVKWKRQKKLVELSVLDEEERSLQSGGRKSS